MKKIINKTFSNILFNFPRVVKDFVYIKLKVKGLIHTKLDKRIYKEPLTFLYYILKKT
jgi:uncharacterized protein YutD